MDLQESKLNDLDLWVKVTQNVAQYHPHHVTYGPVNFEVAMSNGSGEDSFTRNTLFDLGVFDLDPKVKVTWGVA